MQQEPGSTVPSQAPIRRRTITKGLAWSVPTVAAVAAAPVVSASPIPERGLDGWVQLGRQCTYEGTWPWGDYVTVIEIDGRGSYPDRGLWVFTQQGDMPASAKVTFWFQYNNLTFSGGGSGWSALARDSDMDSYRPVAGYYAYSATYNGTWTDNPGTTSDTRRYEAAVDPFWSATRSGGCVRICSYATRTVIYSDTDSVTFTRGPVCLG